MKKILAGILVGVLCISLSACSKPQKSIMEYERQPYLNRDYMSPLYDRLQKYALNKPDGFVIKVTVTEKYKNVLVYDEAEPKRITEELKEKRNFNKLKKSKEHDEFVMIEHVNPFNSYLETTVTVDNIYYLGENIKIREGKSIELTERCFLRSKETDWKVNQDSEEKKLIMYSGAYKLQPGKEYIIFGYQVTSEDDAFKGKYRFFDSSNFCLLVDPERPEGYYDSQNGEQVIDDILNEYFIGKEPIY